MLRNILIDLSGWIPAVIFPVATGIQLYKIFKSKHTEGVSPVTWILFGIANLSLFIFIEKYFSLQAIIGMVGTAIMDFLIVFRVLLLKVKNRSKLKDYESRDRVGGL